MAPLAFGTIFVDRHKRCYKTVHTLHLNISITTLSVIKHKESSHSQTQSEHNPNLDLSEYTNKPIAPPVIIERERDATHEQTYSSRTPPRDDQPGPSEGTA
jgi:hypothetical protein